MQTLQMDQVSVIRGENRLLDQISFSLEYGDHLAILGDAGSGKTTLGKALAGKIFHTGSITYNEAVKHRIVWIPQQHFFKNLSNTSDFYYQQRYNATDNEVTMTVLEYLGHSEATSDILQTLGITYLNHQSLLLLSNGEHKIVQLAHILLSKPAVIILDQPFIGLDTDNRLKIHCILNEQAKQGVHILLITSQDEIPSCINTIILLEQGKIKSKVSREQFVLNAYSPQEFNAQSTIQTIHKKYVSPPKFEVALKMANVTIQYGHKVILNQINWTVRRGERWLLSGPNGAGKSTLLSLITADNPQAYACDLYLFDQKRGTGESIWDIKKKIGYVSPELHNFYDKNITVYDTIASGWYDTIGLYQKINDIQKTLIQEWMDLVQMDFKPSDRLYELSIGHQRIVLLLRALVKNPPLLVLDEPCQGMDSMTEAKMIALIDAACRIDDKSMIYVSHYDTKRPSCIDKLLELKHGVITRNGALA